MLCLLNRLDFAMVKIRCSTATNVVYYKFYIDKLKTS